MMTGIIGASGLIGYNFYKTLKNKKEAVTGTYCSVKKPGLVKLDLEKDGFSLFAKCRQVIIASAKTNIDECSRDRARAYRVNVAKTKELIQYLAERRIKPVFLSSDQVFDGKKGSYTERDRPNPVNYYGDFKLQVEEFIKNNLKDYLILRLSKTYSLDSKEPGMFAEIFLRLKQGKKIKAAYNQIFNPTEVNCICECMYKAIHNGLNGLFHLASPVIMSRYDFAVSVADAYGLKKDLIESVDIRRLGLLEKRPLNTSLIVKKLGTAIFAQPGKRQGR